LPEHDGCTKHHPSVVTSWPNGVGSEPLDATCDELNWSVAQGFTVSSSYYSARNCGNLDESSSVYTGQIAGSSDTSLTSCTTYSSSPTQNGMVVWVLPDNWNPLSGVPEDAVYAIVQNPTNAQLVNNYGFNPPAPPPAGMVTTAPGGVGLDDGIFHYVPPGSTVSVCTNGTTQSDVAIRSLSVADSLPVCNINDTEYTYSGNAYDFIGDGPTPSTACTEMNCVVQIGQNPLWENSSGPTWGSSYQAACFTVAESDVYDELYDQLDHLNDVAGGMDSNIPPHEFAPFVARYLDGTRPEYIGKTSNRWMDATELDVLIHECPLIDNYSASYFDDLVIMINKYEMLTRQSNIDAFDIDFNDGLHIAMDNARANIINGLTSPYLVTETWKIREHIRAAVGNLDGSLTNLLATSGVDLNSPLSTALLAAIPEFSWPFNANAENYFVDTSAGDDLGTLWEDARGIIHACADLSDTLTVMENVINGGADDVDLPDWSPYIEHSSAGLTDYNLTETDFAPISGCSFAPTSVNALSGWNQAIGVVQSHMQFEAGALAGGAANYQLWQQQLVPLESAILPAQLAFWDAAVADANTMLEYWQNISVADVLVQLREYRLAIADNASVVELDQLDNLISTLELAPQESVAWLLQALSIIGINPLDGSGSISAIDMLAFGCALQQAIEDAAGYEDDDGPDNPTPDIEPTLEEADCYGLVSQDASTSASTLVNHNNSVDTKSVNPSGKHTARKQSNTVAQSLNPDNNADPDDCFPSADPREGEQWYLYDEDAGINLAGAPLNQSILIGVIDQGINTLHEDLISNLWVNTDEVADDGLDNDYNGCTDDIHGCNVLTMTGEVHRSLANRMHGTQVAGVMVAEADNGKGIRGINPDAQVIAVRSNGGVEQWITAIDYLGGEGVKVINMSLGGLRPEDSEPFFERILNNPEILFVVSAGNGYHDHEYVHTHRSFEPLTPIAPYIPVYDENTVPYPISPFTDLPNLLVVSALDEQANKHFDTGAQTVHLYAPGIDILTTDVGVDGYKSVDGTSFAAPMVAATASLIMQAEPAITPAEVRQRILSSVGELSDMISGSTITNGRLDIQRALEPTPAARLHMSPQFQTVYTIPGRDDNHFPLYMFNTGRSEPSYYSLTSVDGAISFNDPIDDVYQYNRKLVTGTVDATLVSSGSGFLTSVTAAADGVTETMALNIQPTGTEQARLITDSSFNPFETGKLNLQYDGTHVIVSTGAPGNRSLLVYSHSSANGSFALMQTIGCNEHCAAGVSGESLLVADSYDNSQVNVYQYSAASQLFEYTQSVSLPEQAINQALRSIEVGETFAAVAGFDHNADAAGIYILEPLGSDTPNWVKRGCLIIIR